MDPHERRGSHPLTSEDQSIKMTEGIMRKFPASLPAARCLGALVLLIACIATTAARSQQAFATPEAAAAALVSAVKTGNQKSMLAVLGQDGSGIVSSGDAVADAETRGEFVSAYEAKQTLKKDGDDKATLIVGNDEFPFPIPLVRKQAKWKFDAAAGRDEILRRRIGRNELSTIQACLAYYDAQFEYAEKDYSGNGTRAYAQRIISSPGKKDGLYWPSSAAGDESPLGELVANATAEGYGTGERAPFHGYYYRILTRQGPNARGAAINYVVRGTMIGGFALVAYPANYRNSGVMTFVINHNGTLYQKDLGQLTDRIASRMQAFDPDQSWTVVPTTVPATDKE